MAFNPDGSLFAFDTQDGIQLWDVTFQQQIAFFPYSVGAFAGFAFTPDGQIFAYAGMNQRTIRLWDIKTQQEVGTLEGHTGVVSPITFSLDGKWLASGSSDGVILLWEVNLPPGPVAVEPRGKQFTTIGQIKRTALLQNYPNPFNPETWIPFVLAEAAGVEIGIYDLSGRRVRRLELGNRNAGVYQGKLQAAYWDGKNNAGESVSSGVYFYELRVGRETFARKAWLLK